MKLAIIIQGQSKNVKLFKEKFKNNLGNIIFSTWEGDEGHYDNTDNVIFNKYPDERLPMNFNLQIISTIEGLKLAKTMGFTHALKLRSDMVPTNGDFIFNLLNNDNLNFLCWHNHQAYENCSGYLIDFLMSGKIDDMIQMWEGIEQKTAVPEINITWNLISKNMTDNIRYFVKDLTPDNDFIWLKTNQKMSELINNTNVQPHGKFYYSIDTHHLNQEYLHFFKKK